MSIFDSLGQQPQMVQQGQQPMTPQQMMQARQQMLTEVKKDPHGAIRNAGYNVPDNIDDPMQMAKYLLDSGQIGGPRAQMARQIMARMGR